MSIILSLLIILGAAAIRVMMYHVRYARAQARVVNHLLVRGFKVQDYTPFYHPDKNATPDKEELEMAMKNYEMQIRREEDTFQQFVSFSIFYAAAALLALACILYILNVI